MATPPDALVLLSGGIDSAACARYLQERGERVRVLFVDYGQKAAAFERSAAEGLSVRLGVPIRVVQYHAGLSFGAGEIRGRNAFLIFAAMLQDTHPYAESIALGVHSGTNYYDCSPAFIESAGRVVAEYTDGNTRLVAPFAKWTKRDVFEYFVRAGLPVDGSYSCEAGTSPPCGSCLSCRDRRTLECLP